MKKILWVLMFLLVPGMVSAQEDPLAALKKQVAILSLQVGSLRTRVETLEGQNAELVALANQFFVASEVARLADSSSLSKPKAKPAKAHAAPQDAAWGQDTSGFGISEPADLPTQPNPRTRWLKNFAQRLTR